MGHRVTTEEANSYYSKDLNILCERSGIFGEYKLTAIKNSTMEILEEVENLFEEDLDETREEMKFKFLIS